MFVCFQLPQPAKPWTGVLNATTFQRKCPQANTESELADLQHRIDIGEDVEDCLHLNVYTPQVFKLVLVLISELMCLCYSHLIEDGNYVIVLCYIIRCLENVAVVCSQ